MRTGTGFGGLRINDALTFLYLIIYSDIRTDMILGKGKGMEQEGCGVRVVHLDRIMQAREDAPETTARGHWKSEIRALKNTPYEIYTPTPTAWMEKQAATITKA